MTELSSWFAPRAIPATAVRPPAIACVLIVCIELTLPLSPATALLTCDTVDSALPTLAVSALICCAVALSL